MGPAGWLSPAFPPMVISAHGSAIGWLRGATTGALGIPTERFF
jgi:hypothetical protein